MGPKCERDIITENLEYLRRFAMDSAYVVEQGLWNPSVQTKEDYTILCTTQIDVKQVFKICASPKYGQIQTGTPCGTTFTALLYLEGRKLLGIR